MHITFLVYRLDLARIQTTEFYRQDLEILKDLGHEVKIATRLREVPRETDLIFLWWWNWLWLLGPYLKLYRQIPICVTGSLEPDIYKKRSFLYRFLVRSGMLYADRSVFVSQYMIDGLKKLMRLKNESLCPHIVLDEYKPKSNENKRSDPFVIFNVAWKTKRNTQRKMLPELIEAFSIVHKKEPRAKLILAGEMMDGGPLLEARVVELGLEDSVHFLGKITKNEKIHWMQTCGVYYQCSLHEGFGLAIAEAMACGAPVVVNKKTAIPEVVGDCGFYVKNDSIEEIAQTILRVLENSNEAQQVGSQAAGRVNREFRFARRKNFFKDLFNNMNTTQRQ